MPDGPHRDELGAAQQRIEALEHQNQELRARIAGAQAPPPLAPAPPRRMSSRYLITALVPFVVLASGIVGIVVAFEACRTLAAGSFVASGPAIGSWTLHVDDCRSGQPDGFFGVDLLSSADKRQGVRVIRDAVDGFVVNVNEPGASGRAMQFRADSCKVLDGEVERQNSSVNDVDNLRGRVVFDCSHGDDHVSGQATFESCH